MNSPKAKSFTLSELLVVMIITAIVVGMAFMVLRLAHRQSVLIQRNVDAAAKLANLEQVLAHDFNRFPEAVFYAGNRTLTFRSVLDTLVYEFGDSAIVRQGDTIQAKVQVASCFFETAAVRQGHVDAIDLSAEAEISGYRIFVCRFNDSAIKMNDYGF